MASPNANVDSRGPAVLIVTTIMIILATVFVVLRMASRIFIVHRVSWDDHFMVLAWIIALGLSTAICYGTSVGLGRHEEDVPPEWKAPLKKSEYAFSVLYNPALMATKTSILLFYLALSSKTQKIFQWFTLGTLAVVNGAGLALTFLNIFQCTPFDAAFKTPVPEGERCEDIVTLYLSSAPVNIITDLAILFLPMPILTAMRLPRKQKAILVITFGFGFFVAVVDVIRIAYLQQAALNRLAEMQNSGNSSSGNIQRNNTDVSWYASLSFMWSAIEVNVGIMCACVPGVKPFVSRFLPSLIRNVGSRDNSTGLGSGFGSSQQMQSFNRVPAFDTSGAQRLPSIPSPAPSIPERPTASASTDPEIEKAKDDDKDMDFMGFLTTPDMTEMPENLRRQTQKSTARTTRAPRRRTRPAPESTFFDFVNMRGRKSMVHYSTRECLFPVTMVTILFFLWGVGYGFLDTLNGKFQRIANMSPGQTMGIHSAYFAGYLAASLTFGRLVLKHWGFKACFMVGLCVYGCGALMFWPSAVLTSFTAFLISNLVVGMGLSTLEIAANPFAALCGPPQYAEMRLNLSQGVQAIGSVVTPLLATKVLFKSATDAQSLVDTQWAYLGIALFCVVLAVVYYYVPLPEASDKDFEEAADRTDFANLAEIKGIRVIFITLGLGVFSQFCYVGSQEAVSTSFGQFLTADVNDHLATNNYLAVAHTFFAVARFVGGGLSYFIKPRYLLLTFYIGTIILSVCAMNYTGNSLVAIIMLLFFCEGPIFSIIYGMTLRGMGKHTKDTSALLTAAISGGAVIPPIQYAVRQGVASEWDYSYCVVVAVYAFGAIFAIYCNIVPAARKQVDPIKREDLIRHTKGSRTGSQVSGLRPQSRVVDPFKKRKKDPGTQLQDTMSGAQHFEHRPWDTPSG